MGWQPLLRLGCRSREEAMRRLRRGISRAKLACEQSPTVEILLAILVSGFVGAELSCVFFCRLANHLATIMQPSCAGRSEPAARRRLVLALGGPRWPKPAASWWPI